ncbi:Matrixin [Fodinibius salinus]|uniref:Matrixin n=2 Tax=Fodinibius salinus TaxID=860790 RepID=A0A5D3YS76_9BACT|nr:Matrixin [Fodinibius salinus]
MEDVEALWKTALDKEVLEYRPEEGLVDIHIVFGKEQQRTKKEKQLSQRVQRLKKQILTRKENLERLRKTYEKRKRDFDKNRNAYLVAIKSFNTQIEQWNKQRGGIPPGKKKEVKQMERDIKRLERKVKRKRQNTEMMRKRVNNKLEQVNRLVKKQKNTIDEYKKRFSEARKFNQGQFIAKKDELRINIYQYRNRAELKTVLAHEAGHAMGIRHVDNPKALMNDMLDEQDIFNLKLTQDDVSALAKQCDQ